MLTHLTTREFNITFLFIWSCIIDFLSVIVKSRKTIFMYSIIVKQFKVGKIKDLYYFLASIITERFRQCVKNRNITSYKKCIPIKTLYFHWVEKLLHATCSLEVLSRCLILSMQTFRSIQFLLWDLAQMKMGNRERRVNRLSIFGVLKTFILTSQYLCALCLLNLSLFINILFIRNKI